MLAAKQFLVIAFLFAISFVVKVSSQSTWQQNSILIGGVGIRDVNDDNRYIKINNADIDFLINWDKNSNSEASTFCSKLNTISGIDLKGIVSYYYNPFPTVASDRIFKNTDAAINQINIKTKLNTFKNSDVEGWIVWDEPLQSSDFINLDLVTGYIESNHSDRIAYTNLFPIYVRNNSDFQSIYGSSINDYKNYINSYLSISDRQVLSIDYYPFLYPAYGGIRNDFYQNLKIMREKSLEYSKSNYKIPFWVIIQLSESPTYHYAKPTISQIKWQIYSALAYGAKGIVYYTLLPALDCESGILDSDGNATSIYSDVSTINNQVHKLSSTLIDLIPIETYHINNSPGSQIGLDDCLIGYPKKVYNIVEGVTGSNSTYAMFGYFKHKNTNEDYLLIVNKNFDYSSSLTITLKNTASNIYEISKTTGATVLVASNTKTWNLTLSAGDGRLFKIEDNVEEYIENINDIEFNSTKNQLYLAHDRGVVVINQNTGERRYFNDFGAYTPVVNIEIDNSLGQVYICQDNGSNGNFLATDLNLVPNGHVWNDYGLNTRVTSCAFTTYSGANWIYVGQRSSSNGNVVVLDRNNFSHYSTWATGYKVNDIEYQGIGHRSIAIAHDSGVIRVSTGGDWAPTAGTIYSDRYNSTLPVVDIEVNVDAVYCAEANGSTGKLSKRGPGLWNDLGSWNWFNTRFLDISLKPNNSRITAATISSQYQYFRRFDTALYQTTYWVASTPPARCCFDNSAYLYLCTNTAMYKQTAGLLKENYLNESIEENTIINSFELYNNYPNPFNPSTEIKFFIKNGGRVKLAIYNLLGQEIKLMIDSEVDEGMHSIKWNGTNNNNIFVPSGVYIYKLFCGELTISKKMMLLK